jgi:hypothetical protein
VGLSNLQTVQQSDLFSPQAHGAKLDTAIDGIRGKFGSGLLTRASLLPRTPGGS